MYMIDIRSKGNNVIVVSEDSFDTLMFETLVVNDSTSLETSYSRILNMRFDNYFGQYYEGNQSERENRRVIILLSKATQNRVLQSRSLQQKNLTIDFPNAIRIYYGKNVYCDVCTYSTGVSGQIVLKIVNLVITLTVLVFSVICFFCGIKIVCSQTQSKSKYDPDLERQTSPKPKKNDLETLQFSTNNH